jgi:hypothetical protein
VFAQQFEKDQRGDPSPPPPCVWRPTEQQPSRHHWVQLAAASRRLPRHSAGGVSISDDRRRSRLHGSATVGIQSHNLRSHSCDGRGSMPLHRPAPHQIYPTAPRPFDVDLLTARLWTGFRANGTKKCLRTLACAGPRIAYEIGCGAIRDGSSSSEAPSAGKTRLAFCYVETSIAPASYGGMRGGRLSRWLLQNCRVGS